MSDWSKVITCLWCNKGNPCDAVVCVSCGRRIEDTLLDRFLIQAMRPFAAVYTRFRRCRNRSLRDEGLVEDEVVRPPASDDGLPRIRDLTVEDVLKGKNWLVTNPDEVTDLNLEDLHISETDIFPDDATVVYSAVFVMENGEVSPLLLIKDVSGIDFGGDYCEIHEGRWRQLGLVPDPDAPSGTEYIASPLEQDPSFDTMENEKEDFRIYNRENFKKWANKFTVEKGDS